MKILRFSLLTIGLWTFLIITDYLVGITIGEAFDLNSEQIALVTLGIAVAVILTHLKWWKKLL